MEYNLYSIRDIKTNSFDAPFQSANEETAKRLFHRLLMHIPVMQENPSDFTLHLVGAYSNDNGELKPAICTYICNGLDLVKSSIRDDPNAKLQETKISNEASIQPSS